MNSFFFSIEDAWPDERTNQLFAQLVAFEIAADIVVYSAYGIRPHPHSHRHRHQHPATEQRRA